VKEREKKKGRDREKKREAKRKKELDTCKAWVAQLVFYNSVIVIRKSLAQTFPLSGV
jgi:hypothetical protein